MLPSTNQKDKEKIVSHKWLKKKKTQVKLASKFKMKTINKKNKFVGKRKIMKF